MWCLLRSWGLPFTKAVQDFQDKMQVGDTDTVAAPKTPNGELGLPCYWDLPHPHLAREAQHIRIGNWSLGDLGWASSVPPKPSAC
ncbi:hypothetical protein Ptr902_06392 [Pyrenophora tritici-repentis]|uniref:Uncharacterized protein n=1 Tax=Pyrenophora tritici-repentis TaxID=45151 RepID=A0A834VU88_9PLEO|nr:hypothetical protein PtrM4_005200 [Pyrenophora tritici-repentis]KAI0571070.1 hypothetical protein Alg215_10643 [Pyrenophora tritici-repentis]KAI0573044.1 hypothetical protein Alg130_10253 [Pyrenophora tritici-repentis]KAI0605508.1 hypothetical protein TUN205_10244 [Pyrenophora tritici-repentis]KAI0617859.1 hypothetical protein TUN199_10148 [Pyrenophora tritici-repentis]